MEGFGESDKPPLISAGEELITCSVTSSGSAGQPGISQSEVTTDSTPSGNDHRNAAMECQIQL